VHRGRGAGMDHAAHHVAVAFFRREIDRRRRAFFAAADVAQINRLAEPAMGFADQQDDLALGLERQRRGFCKVIEQPERRRSTESAGCRGR